MKEADFKKELRTSTFLMLGEHIPIKRNKRSVLYRLMLDFMISRFRKYGSENDSKYFPFSLPPVIKKRGRRGGAKSINMSLVEFGYPPNLDSQNSKTRQTNPTVFFQNIKGNRYFAFNLPEFLAPKKSK